MAGSNPTYSIRQRSDRAEAIIADEGDQMTLSQLRQALDDMEGKIQSHNGPDVDIKIALGSREGDAWLSVIWVPAHD